MHEPSCLCVLCFSHDDVETCGCPVCEAARWYVWPIQPGQTAAYRAGPIIRR
jgi:hypothetical protein